MDQKKIGKLITSKRKEKRLTQEQLAERLGVTNKAVSKWENGKSMPDIGIIQDLCKILDITVTTLLNGGESKEEQLVMKLLLVIENLKQLYVIIAGLVVCNIPGAFLEISFVSTLLSGNTFYSGLLNGAFTGLRFIGTILFVYGVAVFYYKMKKVKNRSWYYYKSKCQERK